MRRLSLIMALLFGCSESSVDDNALNHDATGLDQTTQTPNQDAGFSDVSSEDADSPLKLDSMVTDSTIGDSALVPVADSAVLPDSSVPDRAHTIWTGPQITFTKPPGADPTTPEAQDVITDSVVLTRGDGNILYNIAQEMSVTQSTSPAGTLWALGTSEEIDTLEFEPLKAAANDRMQDLPGRDMVLYLVDDNVYIDVRFMSWRSGRGNGGGFSYERSTASAE
tara:strand:+ start:670 stop:1338 length:669 start_codon:yes stop_codon:yes gene_type:complete